MREILVTIEEILFDMCWNMKAIRKIPYPPNFRRIAARIIDPATGASTCALGSHRWVRNMGSFTRNPRIVINQARDIML